MHCQKSTKAEMSHSVFKNIFIWIVECYNSENWSLNFKISKTN